MKNHLTNYETLMLDFKIDQWIERNDLLSSEIKAYKALLKFAKDLEDVFGAKFIEEIERRRIFLKELMHNL